MDGQQDLTPEGLMIEQMTDEELHRKHLAALNKFVMRMDWPTVNPDDPSRIYLDKLGTEMRIRMASE